MYPMSLHNLVHSCLIGAEFSRRIEGVQHVFYSRIFKILLHGRSVCSRPLSISLQSALFLRF